MVESVLVEGVGVFVEVEFWMDFEDVDDLFGLLVDDERREDVDDDDVDVGRGWDSWRIFDVDVLPFTVSDEDGVLLWEVAGFDFEDFIFVEARRTEVYSSIIRNHI